MGLRAERGLASRGARLEGVWLDPECNPAVEPVRYSEGGAHAPTMHEPAGIDLLLRHRLAVRAGLIR